MRAFLRRAARLLQLALVCLLALLLACNLWVIFQQQVMGIDHPTVFGYSAAVVASGSMEPALSVDDMILNHTQDGYAVGDIITFAKGSSLTTHRIVAVTDEGYITQGDANNAPDPDPVAPREVVGRVVVHLPGIGSLLAALKTPLGMTLLFFVGLILLELPFFFRGQRNEREET